MRDEVQFWSDIKKKRTILPWLASTYNYAQLIPVVWCYPVLEMAKCREINAAQEKITGSLSNVYENENHGK